MADERPSDKRTQEAIDESYCYWAKQSPAAGFAETWRLNVEHYGMPEGTLRDGPVVKYKRNPTVQKKFLA